MFLFQVQITTPVKSDAALYAAIKSKNRPEALKDIAALEKELSGKQKALNALAEVKKQVNAMNWSSQKMITSLDKLKAEIAKLNKPAEKPKEKEKEAFVVTLDAANEKFNSEDYKGAAADYKALLEGGKLSDGDRKTAQLNLAHSYDKLIIDGLATSQDAIKAYTAAIDGGMLSKDELAGAYLARASLQDTRTAKGYANAIKDYTSAIENGDAVEALWSRGRLYLNHKEYDKASADYTALIDGGKVVADELPMAYQNRGEAQFQLGKYAEAKADYETALEKYTDEGFKKACTDAIAECDKKLNVAPEKEKVEPAVSPETKSAVKNAKKQVIPLSKVPELYDYMVSQLSSQTGRDVDDIKGEYTEARVNTAFKNVANYIADKSGGEILPKDWEEKLIDGSLALSPQQLAVIKTVSALWLGRTANYAKASFDAVLATGDMNSVLLAIYDNDSGKSALAAELTDASKASKRYWGERVFKGIMEGVEIPAKKEETPEQKVVAEVPGTKDAYDALDAFKQDWRVQAAVNAIGGEANVDYEKCKNDNGKYDVAVIESAVKPILDSEKKQVDVAPERLAASNNLLKISGTLGQDGQGNLTLSGGISKENALEVMKGLGVEVEGNSRKELREKGLGGGIVAVKDADGSKKFYAISQEYQKILPVIKKEVAESIAKGDIEFGPVKSIIREEAKQSLIRMGALEIVGGKPQLTVDLQNEALSGALLNYVAGGKSTDEVMLAIAIIATSGQKKEVEDRSTMGALLAYEPDVKDAIVAKGLGNEQTLAMIAELEKRVYLRDGDANFKKDEVIRAIKEYGAGTPAAAEKQPAAAQEGQEGGFGKYEPTGKYANLVERKPRKLYRKTSSAGESSDRYVETGKEGEYARYGQAEAKRQQAVEEKKPVNAQPEEVKKPSVEEKQAPAIKDEQVEIVSLPEKKNEQAAFDTWFQSALSSDADAKQYFEKLEKDDKAGADAAKGKVMGALTDEDGSVIVPKNLNLRMLLETAYNEASKGQ